jgi:hypothetical protein
LAENPAVNAATEPEVQKLAKAIEGLSVMQSDDAPRNSMNNYGSGTLNANIGKGNQNNNNASGKQFIGQNQYFSEQD